MDNLEDIRQQYLSGKIPTLMLALQMAWQLGQQDAQRELAEELTGGSSILRDPAAVVDLSVLRNSG